MNTNDPRFHFPVALGTQGGKQFYTASIPFGMLARLLAIDVGNVHDRSQRAVDKKRAGAITKYILDNQNSFVIPALTGVVEDESLEFKPAARDAVVGELSISMDATIKLFDGQHRATGIIAAVNAQKVSMKGQCVTVQLFVNMTLADRQQAFSDINSNAKAVSASLNMVYDRRNDAVAAIAQEIEKVSSWAGRIDHENNAVKVDSGMLFSFRHAVQASRLVLGLSAKQVPDEMAVSQISQWWNVVAPAVYWDWQERRERGESYDYSIRPKISNNVAFTAAGLMAIGRVFQLLKTKHGNRFSMFKIGSALSNLDWNKSADMWRGNLVDDSGNMKSGSAGQIAAAELIAEAVSSYIECM